MLVLVEQWSGRMPLGFFRKGIVCGALQTKHLEYKMLEWGWLFDSQSKQKLYLTSVHNLVQVSCYGSCSGSHHEVNTLWGPAMVHQSPVCRLTPHLFLESHMVWLDLAEDDGHGWFTVQMVMTAHYWQSTQSASPILGRQLCEASFATITIMLKQCNFHPLVDVQELVRVQAKWGYCIEYEGLVKFTVICAEGSGWHEVVNCSSGIYPNFLAFQINFCGLSPFCFDRYFCCSVIFSSTA